MSALEREEQVRNAMERGLSQRRPCALMRMARSGLYYERKMALKDAPVIAAMEDLSAQFRRFGARRIHVLTEATKASMENSVMNAFPWSGS